MKHGETQPELRPPPTPAELSGLWRVHCAPTRTNRPGRPRFAEGTELCVAGDAADSMRLGARSARAEDAVGPSVPEDGGWMGGWSSLFGDRSPQINEILLFDTKVISSNEIL